jgi:putative FmdB family regulatory protein
MPIYEYRCKECGTSFSRLQRVGAGSEGVTCPKCESTDVERLLSSFASTSSSPSLTSSTGPSCGSGFT